MSKKKGRLSITKDSRKKIRDLCLSNPSNRKSGWNKVATRLGSGSFGEVFRPYQKYSPKRSHVIKKVVFHK